MAANIRSAWIAGWPWRSRHRRIAAAVMAGMLSIAAPVSADDANAGQEPFAVAKRLTAQGDYRAARIEMLNAIEANPRSVLFRIRQAEIYLRLSDPAAAEGELRQAVDLGARTELVQVLMADALAGQGNFDAAQQWLGRGTTAPDQRAYAARIEGRIAIGQGDLPGAEQAFARAFAIGGERLSLWMDIARLRLMQGDQLAAAHAAERAVALGPGEVSALTLRAQLLRGQFGLAAALPWFERALEIDPSDIPTLTAYGETLGDMGRMRDMLAVARRILALQPDNGRAMFMQAVLAARAGRYELARRLIQKSGGAGADEPATMLVGAIVDYQLGNFQSAIESFGRLAQRQPFNRNLANLLAQALYAAGNHEEVIERFGEQAKRPGEAVYLRRVVAQSMEALGQRENATALLAASGANGLALMTLDNGEALDPLATEAQRAPDDARAVVPYLRKLVAVGRADAAMPWAERLAQANPGIADAQILAGDIALARHDNARALHAYQAAAAITASPGLTLRLVRTLRAVGRADEAQWQLRRQLALNPADRDSQAMLGRIYLDSGNWANAAALLNTVRARTGASRPALLADLAFAQLREGQRNAAEDNARLAYRLQPAASGAAHIFGLTQLDIGGHTDVAQQLLEKAHAIAPENPWIDYHLARAFAKNGRHTEARDALRRALSTGAFPDRSDAVAMLRRLDGAGS